MNITIKDIINDKYIPKFSYIEHRDKKITFSSKNKRDNMIKAYVVGNSKIGRLGATISCSLLFLESDEFLDYLVSEWEYILNREIKNCSK